MFAELSRLFPNSNPHTLQYICDAILPTLSSNCSDKLSQRQSSSSPCVSSFENVEEPELTPSSLGTPLAPLSPDNYNDHIQGEKTFDSNYLFFHKNDGIFDESQKQSKKVKCENSVKIKVQSNKDMEVPSKLERKGGARDKWKPEEDSQLLALYETYGPQWSKIAAMLNNKTGKQVRDRYINNLKPELSHKEWTKEEETLFISLYKKYGNKWSKIAQHLPGRSGNQVKNKFYCDKKRTIHATKDIKEQSCGQSPDNSETFVFPEKPLADHSNMVKETVDVFFEVQTLETTINICDIDFDDFAAQFNGKLY